MRIGVLGTGMVGQALATKLAALGHAVMMGARAEGDPKAEGWATAHGGRSGDFAATAAFGEMVVFATAGDAVLAAAERAGPTNLAGKVVIDGTNPLDFSNGFPPTLIPALSNTTSAAEELQKCLPEALVVKALNTVNCAVMVDPGRVPGLHDIFYCGDDAAAKADVRAPPVSFAWTDPVELGPLAAALGMEGLMLFWLRTMAVVGSPDFNQHIARA